MLHHFFVRVACGVSLAILAGACGSTAPIGRTTTSHSRLRSAGVLGIPRDRKLHFLTKLARGGRGSTATAPRSKGPVRFRDTELHVAVANAGEPLAFSLYVSEQQDFTVYPSSASVARVTIDGDVRFVSASDRQHWIAAGRLRLPRASRAGQVATSPAGSFTFLPQGTPLSYRAATALPTSASDVARVVRAHLLPYVGPHPPAALRLREFGFLLGTAPIGRGTRAAILLAVRRLPGLRSCGTQRDPLGRRGVAACIYAANEESVVLFDPRTAAVLAVEQRLRSPAVLFPGLPAGAIIEYDAFSA
jgi:hypothetical protein